MSQRRRDTLPKKRSGSAGPASQRRISRREREERQRRQLYIGLAIAGVLSLVILAGFALNEYILKPRAVLASVNGVEIRRRDYWKVRSVELVNQVNQYNQFSQLVDPSQQQQYLTLAQQAASELDKVWGSTDTNDSTLNRMVEDQVYLQSMDGMGLSVTDQDVQNYLWQQFEPQNAPIFTPTPSPTLIPQRAEWATQTEVALQAENQTPTSAPAVSSPGAEGGTPRSGPGDSGRIPGRRYANRFTCFRLTGRFACVRYAGPGREPIDAQVRQRRQALLVRARLQCQFRPLRELRGFTRRFSDQPGQPDLAGVCNSRGRDSESNRGDSDGRGKLRQLQERCLRYRSPVPS